MIALTGLPQRGTSEECISGFSDSLKHTVYQNDGKTLMSSFSVKSMFRTSLKYGSTSENARTGNPQENGSWVLRSLTQGCPLMYHASLRVCSDLTYDHGWKHIAGQVCMDFNRPPLLQLRIARTWPNARTSHRALVIPCPWPHLSMRLSVDISVVSRRPIQLDRSHPVN